MAEAQDLKAASSVESVHSVLSDRKSNASDVGSQLLSERESIERYIVCIRRKLERLATNQQARTGGVDVGASDKRAATVPMRRHHKRASGRCTSPESLCSRLDDSAVRHKPKSSGLAVHSSPGEIGPDTAVVHPLLSAFPRRSSSSQPLVPDRERQHSTSSRQLDSDSVESAASLNVARKAEHGKRLGLADCLFPASSRAVDRAEYLKSGVRR